jgi:hypothetical protein
MPREELNRKLNMEYQDVTTRVLKRNKKHYKVVEQQYYIDENGNKYAVDGKSVLMKHTEKEKEVAKILGEIYGGKVRLIPVVLNVRFYLSFLIFLCNKLQINNNIYINIEKLYDRKYKN